MVNESNPKKATEDHLEGRGAIFATLTLTLDSESEPALLRYVDEFVLGHVDHDDAFHAEKVSICRFAASPGKFVLFLFA